MDTSSLMEQILSSDNLNRAYLQVVRNKGAEGVDGMKYTELKEYLAKNGEIIKEQLRTRKYKPQPVRRVEIPKPDGGVRNLGVPTVTDRFIQQAIAQVLTPIYEEQFHEHSYGFRPNRCAQQAIITALDMMNDGNDWIVDIDLEKFFDTVNHDKLMTIIGRTIKDGDVISIIRKYLVSGIMIDDEYEDSIVGTPQGGNLAPLLANIMLNELDKEMEKRGLNFVRYADDCIITAINKYHSDTEKEIKFLEDKLREKDIKLSVTDVWGKGGEGAIDLAEKIVKLVETKNKINFVYKDEDKIKEKIEKVAEEIYGASGVEYTEEAEEQILQIEKLGYGNYPVCIAKTQYSFSDNAKNLLCDEPFKITIKEVVVKNGAEFVVVKTGKIFTMPGLPSVPAAEKIRLDENEDIVGIF